VRLPALLDLGHESPRSREWTPPLTPAEFCGSRQATTERPFPAFRPARAASIAAVEREDLGLVRDRIDDGGLPAPICWLRSPSSRDGGLAEGLAPAPLSASIDFQRVFITACWPDSALPSDTSGHSHDLVGVVGDLPVRSQRVSSIVAVVWLIEARLFRRA